MISIEAEYFGISRRLSLSVGLWPYQHSIFTQLQFLFSWGILISAIVLHLTNFVTTEFTLNLIVKILSSICIFITLLIKYIAFWINGDTIKFVLEQLQRTYDELKDKNEHAIIEKYGYTSKRICFGVTISVACGIVLFILMQSSPSILDVTLPRNESRPRYLLLPMEYIADHEKYFCLILLHISVLISVAGIIVLATGLVLIACQEFICGMFTVTSYRLERAMRIVLLENASPHSKNLISKGIIEAVDIHRRAMKFSELLQTKFEVMLASLIVTSVMGLSLNLLRIFQTLSSEFNIEEFLLPGGFVIIIILYMFLVAYVGQDLTDHNSRIFVTAYNVPWYRAPLHVQKLILFLLQKGNKDFILNVGGLINGSLESFASLTNISMSYFTVLYATQK